MRTETIKLSPNVKERCRISEVQYTPYTERDILNDSVGEITEYTSLKDKNALDTMAVREDNTIFSDILFGYKARMRESNVDRGTNIAHIRFPAPIIIPNMFSIDGARNVINILLAAKTGSVLKQVLNCNFSLIIPNLMNRNISKPSKFHEFIKNMMKSDYYKDKIKEMGSAFDSFNLYSLDTVRDKETEDSTGNVSFIKQFQTIPYYCIENSKVSYFQEIFREYIKTLSDYSLEDRELRFLTGGYALAYLLGQINIQEYLTTYKECLNDPSKISNIRDFGDGNSIPTENAFTVPYTKLSEQIDLIADIVNGGGMITDYITRVVPVIPAAYRDIEVSMIKGVAGLSVDNYNTLYAKLLEQNNKLKIAINNSSIATASNIPSHLDIYTLSSEITKLLTEQLYCYVAKETQKDNISFITQVDSTIEDINLKLSRYTKSLLDCIDKIPTLDICSILSIIQSTISTYNTSANSDNELGNDKSQLSKLGAKEGIIRARTLSKRIDESGRSVLTVDPKLRLNEIGIPFVMLATWLSRDLEFEYKEYLNTNKISGASFKNVVREIESNKSLDIFSVKKPSESSKVIQSIGAKQLSKSLSGLSIEITEKETKDLSLSAQFVINKLRDMLHDLQILFIRYPSLHKYNEQTFKPVLVFDETIHFHPLVCSSYNADFDGDTGSTFLLRLKDAVLQARHKMTPTANMTSASGSPMHMASQDAILGIHYLTMREDVNDAEPYTDPNYERERILYNLHKSNGSNIVSTNEQSVQLTLSPEQEERLSKISPVVASYSSYEDMFRDLESHRIRIHDKVGVHLPKYSNSIFLKNYDLYYHNLLYEDMSSSLDSFKMNCLPSDSDIDNILNTECFLDEEGNHCINLSLNRHFTEEKTPIDNVYNQEVWEYNEKDSQETMYIVSTAGRFVFNSIIPQDLGFIDRNKDNPTSFFELEVDKEIEGIIPGTNTGLNAKAVSTILSRVIAGYDVKLAAYVHDAIKELGYYYATMSGASLSLGDMSEPKEKQQIIKKYQQKVDELQSSNLSNIEKRDNTVNLWNKCSSEVEQAVVDNLDSLNPLKLMSGSGARGNRNQLMQLMGMKGIMNDATGTPVETPIFGSLLNGLGGMDLIISSYGANKGMIDRANSTKDTGDLTRNMVYATNDILVTQGDCGTDEGLIARPVKLYSSPMNSGEQIVDDRGNVLYTPRRVVMFNNEVLLNKFGDLILDDQVIVNIYNHKIIDSYLVNTIADINLEITKDKNTIQTYYTSITPKSETSVIKKIEIITSLNDTIFSVLVLGKEDEVLLNYNLSQKYFSDDIVYADCEHQLPIYIPNIFVNPFTMENINWNNSSSVEVNVLQTSYKLIYDKISDSEVKVTKVNKDTLEETLLLHLEGTNLLKDTNPIYFGSDSADSVKIYPSQAVSSLTCKEIQAQNNVWLSKNWFITSIGTEILVQPIKNLSQYKFKLNGYTVLLQDGGEVILTAEYNDIISDLQGRVPAYDIIDKKTGEVLVRRNQTMVSLEGITDSTLKKINEQYVEGVEVRSPMTCKAHTGVCSRCCGFNYSNNSYSKIGDAIGITAAHTLGEFFSQATMRTFHTGGSASAGDVTGGFKAVESLLLSGNVNDKYLTQNINTASSTMIKPINLKEIENAQLKARELQQALNKSHRSVRDIKLGTDINELYLNGELIKDFNLEHLGVIRMSITNALMQYFRNQLRRVVLASGKSILGIYLEILIHSMTSHFRVVSSGDSTLSVGSIISLKDLLKENLALIDEGREVIVVSPVITNVKQAASSSSNPTVAMGFSNLKKNSTHLMAHYKKDNLINSITPLGYGISYPTGNAMINKIDKITRIPKSKTVEESLQEYNDRSQQVYNRLLEKYNITDIQVSDIPMNTSQDVCTPEPSIFGDINIGIDLTQPTDNNDTEVKTKVETGTETGTLVNKALVDDMESHDTPTTKEVEQVSTDADIKTTDAIGFGISQ